MITNRLIARLDVKNNALVKGIHLEGLRVLGNPNSFGERYYYEGIDELIYMDVVASLYNRNSLHDLIKKTAEKIFVPLAVGGGVRTENDVKELLRSGADKVIINTAAVKDPGLIKRLVNRFGSSTIVVAIEAIKDESGEHGVYIDNGREYTGLKVIDWASQVEEYGAGEIILTSVDNEGTGKGLNYELIKEVTSSAGIPVVVHGGVGSVQHLVDGFHLEGINSICVSSMFHYDLVSRADFGHENVMGNTAFLKSDKKLKKNLDSVSIEQCKKELILQGVALR